MPSISANTAWFTITLNGRTDFQVYSFSGSEAVCKPYEFVVEAVHPSAGEELTGVIGAPALLSIADRSGQSRLVHGLVREMRRLHRGNHLAHYQCVIVPRLWFLGQNREHRIFQGKSVPDIITLILNERGFASETFAFRCFHDYHPREYCVQYGESDLHFISRLCEEEGIYYYFEHSETGHCVCFSDMAGGPRIGGESALRCFSGSGQVADTAVVCRAELHVQSVSDKATYRDWNFQSPSTLLEASATETDFQKAPVAPGVSYDVYRYPHLHQTMAEGERYAQLQLLRQLAMQRLLEAESDVSRFMPGFVFALYGHEREDMNAGWWIVSVTHHGEQPQVLGREAPDRGMRYASGVTAIPETTRFVPETAHAKNRIMGEQNALVTGPEGEEIYPDEHGRVKVQFFWDREGAWNEHTSCWLRVSHGWAGTGFGALALPRIGHEVIVSFLEGDPDRPVVTGRLYNAGSMPPYELPEDKSRTVFKSMSTPGDDGARGFNELSVEDAVGREEIWLHAEKDANVHVKHDWKGHVVHDKHRLVSRHAHTRTEGETHEKLTGLRKVEQHADESLTVHACGHTRVDGKWLRRVGSEVHLYAGETAVFEADAEAALRGGASWIRLDVSGASMGGPHVSLGGGGAAEGGTPATPLLPEGSSTPQVPVVSGACQQKLLRAAHSMRLPVTERR